MTDVNFLYLYSFTESKLLYHYSFNTFTGVNCNINNVNSSPNNVFSHISYYYKTVPVRNVFPLHDSFIPIRLSNFCRPFSLQPLHLAFIVFC